MSLEIEAQLSQYDNVNQFNLLDLLVSCFGLSYEIHGPFLFIHLLDEY